MNPVHLPERGGQHSAPTEGEQVAGDDVVEPQHAREHAGHDQDLGHVAHDRRDHVPGERDHHRVGARRGGVEGVLGAEPGDHQPGGDGVEHADQQHRDVGGARDGAQRVTGLVAEHGGRLEAEEAEEGEEEPEPRRARERLGGAERHRGELAAGGEHAEVDREHREDLEHQHHAEHRGGEVDAAMREHAHHGDHQRGDQPPRQLDPGPQGEQVPGLHAEIAGHRHGQQHVAEQGDRRGAQARPPPEALVDVGVEGAGVGDVRGHPGEADGEEQQDERGREDHQRRADAPGLQQDQREVRDHHGDRGRGGDHHQHDAGHSQRSRHLGAHRATSFRPRAPRGGRSCSG